METITFDDCNDADSLQKVLQRLSDRLSAVEDGREDIDQYNQEVFEHNENLDKE